MQFQNSKQKEMENKQERKARLTCPNCENEETQILDNEDIYCGVCSQTNTPEGAQSFSEKQREEETN